MFSLLIRKLNEIPIVQIRLILMDFQSQQLMMSHKDTLFSIYEGRVRKKDKSPLLVCLARTWDFCVHFETSNPINLAIFIKHRVFVPDEDSKIAVGRNTSVNPVYGEDSAG